VEETALGGPHQEGKPSPKRRRSLKNSVSVGPPGSNQGNISAGEGGANGWFSSSYGEDYFTHPPSDRARRGLILKTKIQWRTTCSHYFG
jgi:hypothetical protein